MNPNMRNNKLRDVFEKLGFTNVKTVISSGNVIFDSRSTDTKKLETTIESALFTQLGFHSTTIIRSKEQLQNMYKKNPFNGMEHSQKTSLNVTFLKNSPAKTDIQFPYISEKKDYTVLGIIDNAVCSVIDVTSAKTPNVMAWLEKKFGKEITTRTWKTVERILKVMG